MSAAIRSRLLYLSPVATLVFGLAGWLGGTRGHGTLEAAFFVLAYIAGGTFPTYQGVRSLLRGQVDVDLLMVVAALGAASVGHAEDGAILFFLFSTSNAMQDYALNRTRQAVTALMALRPDVATVVDESGERDVPCDEVEVGARILIRPGERVPLDARVVSGATSVDQAAITGESVPVPKEPGDLIFAGTVNIDGVIEARVEKPAAETTLARIVRMVSEAQAQKADLERWSHIFEQRYSLAVLGGTALAIVVPLLLGHAFGPTFYRAMTLLVAASPCAVVIAAPSAMLSALANLARHGILVKGGAHLERLASVDAVAFDKTGTLTRGEPRITAVIPAGDATDEEVLSLAAALEAHVDHPLAWAVRRHAEEVAVAAEAVEDVQIRAGRGVAGTLRGSTAYAGSPSFIAEQGVRLPDDLAKEVARREEAGETIVLVASGDRAVGLLAALDEPRAGAADALRRLHRVGVKEIVMLSGDQPRVVERIAAELPIDASHGGLLPEQKVEATRELAKTRHVAMVGDGVNDAPALAAATVGVAMGGAGTDVALETADVVLMGDDLEALAYGIAVAKRARAVVRQGLMFAGAVIVGLVTLVLLGEIRLPLSVVGHEGSTVVVALSGLRLLLSAPLRTNRPAAQPLRRGVPARDPGGASPAP